MMPNTVERRSLETPSDALLEQRPRFETLYSRLRSHSNTALSQHTYYWTFGARSQKSQTEGTSLETRPSTLLKVCIATATEPNRKDVSLWIFFTKKYMLRCQVREWVWFEYSPLQNTEPWACQLRDTERPRHEWKERKQRGQVQRGGTVVRP